MGSLALVLWSVESGTTIGRNGINKSKKSLSLLSVLYVGKAGHSLVRASLPTLDVFN